MFCPPTVATGARATASVPADRVLGASIMDVRTQGGIHEIDDQYSRMVD